MTAKKVLIVDDEADICELIEITLLRKYYSSQPSRLDCVLVVSAEMLCAEL